MLFKLAKGGLRPRELAPWPHSSYLPAHMFIPEVLPPTVFSYGGYTNVKAYPNGMADCTGYWVEFEIFGGVIVFDRGTSGSEVSTVLFLEKEVADQTPVQVCFHSPRRRLDDCRAL
jgi:hypothetical protein